MASQKETTLGRAESPTPSRFWQRDAESLRSGTALITDARQFNAIPKIASVTAAALTRLPLAEGISNTKADRKHDQKDNKQFHLVACALRPAGQYLQGLAAAYWARRLVCGAISPGRVSKAGPGAVADT